MNVNCIHVSYLIKALLPHLTSRPTNQESKSAIIIISSLAGESPAPLSLTYSCTKSFATMLAEGLNFELQAHKIDVMSYNPGNVNTNLTLMQNNNSSISAEEAA